MQIILPMPIYHYQRKMTKAEVNSNLTEVGLGVWVQPLPAIQYQFGGSRSRGFLGFGFGAPSSAPVSGMGFAGSSFLASFLDSSLDFDLADSFGWDGFFVKARTDSVWFTLVPEVSLHMRELRGKALNHQLTEARIICMV